VIVIKKSNRGLKKVDPWVIELDPAQIRGYPSAKKILDLRLLLFIPVLPSRHFFSKGVLGYSLTLRMGRSSIKIFEKVV
jgi:hypothetical protein